MTPGLYKYTHGDYHNLKTPTAALSQSYAKILLQQSPLHAMSAHRDLCLNPTPRKDSKYSDLGSAVHAVLLEGDFSKIVGVEADDWKKQTARDTRDKARSERKHPVLARQLPEIEAMALACRQQLSTHREASDAFTNGEPEVSMVWQEPNGVWCRGRMDWLQNDRPVIDDYKTVGRTANPDVISRTLFTNGWDIQAAFYLRGLSMVRSTVGLERGSSGAGTTVRVQVGGEPLFRFVVQETERPYALSVISLNPAALALANAKVERAIRIWGECLRTGRWPGYTDRVAFVDLPSWEENRFMEMEGRDEDE